MAVDAGITPPRKTELHARLLAALEEHGDADPALLAHHAEGAGDARAVLRHAPEAAVRDIGERLGYPDLVSFVLNATGLYLVDAGQGGMPELEDSLRLALEADLSEAAGRAYSSLMEAATKLHRFPDAERYLRRGPRLLRA